MYRICLFHFVRWSDFVFLLLHPLHLSFRSRDKIPLTHWMALAAGEILGTNGSVRAAGRHRGRRTELQGVFYFAVLVHSLPFIPTCSHKQVEMFYCYTNGRSNHTDRTYRIHRLHMVQKFVSLIVLDEGNWFMLFCLKEWLRCSSLLVVIRIGVFCPICIFL